jgi:hypothetical protein
MATGLLIIAQFHKDCEDSERKSHRKTDPDPAAKKHWIRIRNTAGSNLPVFAIFLMCITVLIINLNVDGKCRSPILTNLISTYTKKLNVNIFFLQKMSFQKARDTFSKVKKVVLST